MKIYTTLINTTLYHDNEKSSEYVEPTYEHQAITFTSWPTYGNLSSIVNIPKDLDRNALIPEDGMNHRSGNYNLHITISESQMIDNSKQESSVEEE